MELYEIRTGSPFGPASITQGKFASAHAAVRMAERIAQGQPFEVWRGMECIYSATTLPIVRRLKNGEPPIYQTRNLTRENGYRGTIPR
jgi:hypothetical protein